MAKPMLLQAKTHNITRQISLDLWLFIYKNIAQLLYVRHNAMTFRALQLHT